MADLTESGSLRAGRPKSSSRSRSGQKRINTFLFWSLLLLAALAPLPFGSARAIFWGIWASYIGIVGVLYFVALGMAGEKLRVAPGQLWIAIGLFGATCAFLVFQLVPFGDVLIVEGNGVAITAPQLSIAPNLTLLMLLRQLTYGLFFLLVMQVMVNDSRRATALHLLMLIVVIYGLYALVALQMGDTILGMVKWAYHGSATGTFVNRNSFATFVGFGAVLALSQACAVVVRQAERHSHDGRIRNYMSSVVLYGLAYAFLLVVLVATQSRMGLFATLAGSGLVVVITMFTVGKLRFVLFVLPIGLLVLAGALYLIGGGLFERIENLELSTEGRLNLYRQVLDLIVMRPLTGFGGGSFEVAFPLVHQLPLNPDYAWTRGHNTYLTLWAELGVIAGSLPMLAIAYLAFRIARSLIRGDGSWTAQTAALGVIAVGAIHSLADFSLEIQADALFFIAVVATGTATSTIKNQRKA